MSKWTDLADWRPTTHHGGRMSEHRGVVLHIAEGYYEGTIAWQQGDNAVSSHFVIGREQGETAQLVDTDYAAWTQRGGNSKWLSVEFAGFTKHHPLHRPGWEKLSPWQIQMAALILARAHLIYNVPLQLASSSTGRGLGHHSMGGAEWGHRDCPGPPIIAQKAEVLEAAHLLIHQPESGDDMPSAEEIVQKLLQTDLGKKGGGDTVAVALQSGLQDGRSALKAITGLQSQVAGLQTQVAQLQAKLGAVPPTETP